MKRKVCLMLVLMFLAALPACGEELRGYDKVTRMYVYAVLGTYPTDADGTVRPVVWRVLETDDSVAYLLSELILEAKQLHHIHTPYPGWEGSDLFAYLNGDFKDRVFTPGEQSMLISMEGLGIVTLPDAEDIRNPEYGFSDNNSRKCKSTAYAKTTGLYEYEHNSYHPFWTRTRSTGHAHAQRRTMDKGKIGYQAVTAKDLGVRPAVWVDLTKTEIQGGNGTLADPYLLMPAVEKPSI